MSRANGRTSGAAVSSVNGQTGAVVLQTGALTTTATKTGTYTASPGELVPCDATGGTFAVTLPAANVAGQVVTVKKLDASANAVTVQRAGSDVINVSGTTMTLTYQFQAVTLISSGSGVWTVQADDLPLGQLDTRYPLSSTATTKGDLLAASAAATLTRVGVGADNTFLKANSGQTAGVQWASVTDTATVPAADATVGAAGSNALASARDHTHPRYQWTPVDEGYVTASVDKMGANTSTALPSAGRLELSRVHLPVAATVTNIIIEVGSAGSGLTSGQCFAALYTAAGAWVASTADQSTSWNSTGYKIMPLSGGPYSRPAGDHYVALWFNGTTPPSLARVILGNFGDATFVNGGLTAPNLRYAFANTGTTTAAPGTLGTQTATSVPWWVALS